jgi:sterol 3beta-glucosyltransferase
MRVLIATVGGRGDVAPFTGLGMALRDAGHSVTVASNDEYESLVAGCGLGFCPLPGTRGMFDDPRWVQGSGGPASAVSMIRLLAEHMRTIHKAILAVARQDAADVLALAGIAQMGYHVAEGLGLPGMSLLLQPMHTTADFPPSFVSGRSFGRLGNRVAGTAAATALALAMAGRPGRSGVNLACRGGGSAKRCPGSRTPGGGRSSTASAQPSCRIRRTGRTAMRSPATGGRSGQAPGARRRS